MRTMIKMVVMSLKYPAAEVLKHGDREFRGSRTWCLMCARSVADQPADPHVRNRCSEREETTSA